MAQRNWDQIGWAIALLALGYSLWKHQYFFHDDAYISLRYAHNLSEFGALEWNLGERVEGYTNFLHVLLTSVFLSIDFSPENAVRLIGLSSTFVLILAVSKSAKLLLPKRGHSRVLAVGMVGFTPGVAIWALGGLETVMLASFLAMGTYNVLSFVLKGSLRDALFSGGFFSLAVLTRMDSAVFIAASGIAILLFGESARGLRFCAAILISAVPATVSLAHMYWRLSYYGLPFPLTFYAKSDVPWEVQRNFLTQYLFDYVSLGLPYLLAAVLASVLALTIGRTPSSRVIALPLLASCAYVLWSGGDHMPGARVFIPLSSSAVLVIFALPFLRTLVAPLAFMITVLASLFHPAENIDKAARVGTIIGTHIDREWPKSDLIALSTAGSTPFHAMDHRFLDMLGLNDAQIALRKDIEILSPWQLLPGHTKGDGKYVLARQPDKIILGPSEGTTLQTPWFLSDFELADSGEFNRCYEEKIAEVTFDQVPNEMSRLKGGRIKFIWYERTCPKTR